jgi:hypothetical protein
MMAELARWCVVGLVVACGCRGKSEANSAGQEAMAAQGRSGVSAASPRTFRDSALTVTASPRVASELVLPVGVTPLDLAASPTRPEVAILVRDSAGRARVISWAAGSGSTSLVAELPSGFSGQAIASHPAGGALFVAGGSGGRSELLRLEPDGALWRSTVILETAYAIERLIVAPRPYETNDGIRHRLFFSAKLPDGNTSLRSVTETGKIEYQVVGPQATVVKLDSAQADEQPAGVIAPSGVPMGFHPRGEPLLWQDGRGCAHLLTYSFSNWGTDHLLASLPCGGSGGITPNGAAYLQWRSGTPGISVIRAAGSAMTQQASQYTFAAAPVSVPDGRGVIGIVSRPGSRFAMVFAPIAVLLADVADAWQLSTNACDEEMFTRNAGLFREESNADQLYSLYDANSYGTDYPAPLLVTTDLLWENFGTAFNGVFILLERRHASAAFRAFVDAANAALHGSSPESRWAKAFAAVAAFYRGVDSGEAGRIARGDGPAQSSVLDSLFHFEDLKPRGHYTTSPEMEQYFRGVHYLTTLSQWMDPAPLRSLPRDVQRKALDWIGVYQPFVAPPRSRLVWEGATSFQAPYARHPWAHGSLFPLSWGMDNEVLESSVFHKTWPVAEQIGELEGRRRLTPSGLDVAAMFGNPLARFLLAADFATYPHLGPVLEGIAARRPVRADSMTLYERWLDALAVEWADSSAIPGTPATAPVWPAKRLQTGLASWATLREATILVTERAGAAEAGEGGFEVLVPDKPRGYVEPAPRTFEAIAGLYDALASTVSASRDLDAAGGRESNWSDEPLRQGILRRLAESAAEARHFARMAQQELGGEALSDSDYDAIRYVGGSAEHEFLVYKSLAQKDLALSTPYPLPKIADVAGDSLGLLEAAVGGPLEWDQIVPFFGRREIVIGSAYSYYEFLSRTAYDNERWRKEIQAHPRPKWIQPLIAPPAGSCRPSASR